MIECRRQCHRHYTASIHANHHHGLLMEILFDENMGIPPPWGR